MVSNDPFIGQQIGNYRILTRINSGTFGSVYRGQHLIFEDEPIVAIKVLHASLASQEERTAFVKEAQLLKKLQHPHILHILDAGFHNSLPYLVTEYASGGSLRDRLRQYNGPMPVDEAVSLLTQVGEALSYAHQQNIVHRDLKPENILFNGNREALLADFGIAVLLTSARTGMMGRGGTPSYMAPEQFEGLASTKSDQYALGCIAYELVTGRRLFSLAHPSLEAFWYHHAKVEPVAPKNYNSALPTYIEQAILTALTKDRTKRYHDIATFMQALSRNQEQWMAEAVLFFKSGHYDEALAACEQAIRLDPNDAYAYCGKGTALNFLNRYEEALAACEQAIHLDSNYDVAYHNKGNALDNLERYEEALSAYEQAIRLAPNLAGTYIGKGNALTNLKRYEEALTAYEQAIHLDPNFAAAYYCKGNALTNLKRYEEALTAYEQAIHLDPNLVWAYFKKGNALNFLKRYKEALTAYEQAIHLDPNFAPAYHNKGVALERLGKSSEAQQAYTRAKALGYEN